MSVLGKRRLNVAFTKYQGGPSKKSARTGEPMQIATLVNARNSNSSTTQQAMRVGGWANPGRGGEMKFKDNIFGGNPPVSSAAFSTGQLLNGIATGSAATDRIGRKVVIKSLLIRWRAYLQSSSLGGSPIRILIVYDKQANATAPAITDILLTDSFTAQNNLSNRDRFVTLSDFITEPLSVQDCWSRAGVIYKKLNLEVMFNATGTDTIGDITSGSIYMFVAQTSAVSVAEIDFAANTRIRYSDN